MRTPVLPLLILLAVAHVAQAEAPEGGGLEKTVVEDWVHVPKALFLWAEPFEHGGLNHALNIILGTAQALAGTILVSHGQRQVDFSNSGMRTGFDGSQGAPRVKPSGPCLATLCGSPAWSGQPVE